MHPIAHSPNSRSLLRIASLLICSLLLAGCVTEPARITSTQSGKPEVTITSDDIASIKGAIISDLVDYRYTVQEDTAYRLVLARPTDGMESFGATMATGNAYSTNPERVADFTFAKLPEGTRVVASLYYRSQMALGQVRTSPITNTGSFNEIQALLQQTKRLIEAAAPKTSAPPPKSPVPDSAGRAG